MKRKTFLKKLSLAGAGAGITAVTFKEKLLINDCTLIPAETAGPFPLDLSENAAFFRKEINETRTGVPLRLRMRIIGSDNCEPLSNVRVNIWHCDKDGLYSGYQTEIGQTYCRGYQIADANGEVEFKTIFPGWYTGRICHIHFQVYVSSSYAAISQLTFEIEPKNKLYGENASLYTKGLDPLDFNQDGIFSDGYQYQLATLTFNEETGEYESFLEVAVRGSGTTGLGYLEKETAKYLTLSQNFPNPYLKSTLIPFKVIQPGQVKINLWDLAGKKVLTLLDEYLLNGEYEAEFKPDHYGLVPANYIYQMELTSADNKYVSNKMMTHI